MPTYPPISESTYTKYNEVDECKDAVIWGTKFRTTKVCVKKLISATRGPHISYTGNERGLFRISLRIFIDVKILYSIANDVFNKKGDIETAHRDMKADYEAWHSEHNTGLEVLSYDYLRKAYHEFISQQVCVIQYI